MVVADGLTVSLGRTPVLADVGFSVAPGTWVGLLGPNGAGKTTLLRSLGGLVDYTGHLAIDGREVRTWQRRDLARKVAFVRQSVSLAFDFRVEDLVLLGRSPHRPWLSSYDDRDHSLVEDALGSVDLEAFAGRSIHSLSSGEQQRVFLAQALVQEPDVLLLDEPTAHLDIHHRLAFADQVRRQVESGLTVVAAFHDLELAARYSDQVVVLDHGSVADSGTPAAALTSELIADVFRVRATVVSNGRVVEGVRYHENLSGPPRPSTAADPSQR